MDLSWLANLPGQLVQNSAASGNQGQMNAGSNYASASDPDLLRQLAQIRQYDPGASIGSAPGDEQGGGGPLYSVSFDQGKLPTVPTSPDGQRWARPTDFASSFQQQMDTGGSSPAIAHSVIDPSQNIDSAYGTLTPGSNVTTQEVPTKPGFLNTYGPMMVGLMAGGIPALFEGAGLAGAGAGLGGELGASAAGAAGPGSSLGSAFTKYAMGAPGQIEHGFNPMSLTSLAGPALGAAGMSPAAMAQVLAGSMLNNGVR